MKAINRLIVTSSTYRQSSKMTAEHRTRDAENRLYARASRFRMPSMILRDWALASSGLLDRQIGGKPVYPYQPDQVWEALAITKERDFTYPASSGPDLYRRSLYTFWRRTVNPANMFDASSRQTCRVRPSTTSTPLHALTTLNDPTWVEAARALAERSMKASGVRRRAAHLRVSPGPGTPSHGERPESAAAGVRPSGPVLCRRRQGGESVPQASAPASATNRSTSPSTPPWRRCAWRS